MDARYQPLYKQAAQLQHQFHDYTRPMAHDPNAMVLRNQIHHLTNDLANGKNPRTIENRVRVIQQQLKRSQHPEMTGNFIGQQPLLNYKQNSLMRNNFDKMRTSLRQHPHF